MPSPRVNEPKNCKECGKQFYPFRSAKGTYCSRQCAVAAMRGNDRCPWFRNYPDKWKKDP